MKISIIVPVYNAERYLVRNIESLLALETDETEFIYINDGSTDKSGDILCNYAHKDNRIVVERQENRGLSAARNRGMELAKGEWILFVDADDWLDKMRTETFFREADRECDLIWGAYSNVNEDEAEESFLQEEQPAREIKSGAEWLCSGRISYSACVYLYRSVFLKTHEIRFPDGFLHEDMEFIPEVFTFAQRVKKTDIVYYMRFLHDGSISTTGNVKRSTDLLQIADHLELFFEQSRVKGLAAYKRNYLAFLCTEAVHLAVLAGIDIDEIFRGDPERKRKAVGYLGNSLRVRDRLAGCLLKLNLSKLYRAMYLVYHDRHGRTKEKSNDCK